MTPYVGMQVWFKHYGNDVRADLELGIIVCVNDDSVNLCVFSHSGITRGMVDVKYLPTVMPDLTQHKEECCFMRSFPCESVSNGK